MKPKELNQAERDVIVEEATAGRPYREIAVDAGITPSAVSRIALAAGVRRVTRKPAEAPVVDVNEMSGGRVWVVSQGSYVAVFTDELRAKAFGFDNLNDRPGTPVVTAATIDSGVFA